MSDSSEAFHGKQNYPTSFGRGWIPVERDIGLPEDDLSSSPPLKERGLIRPSPPQPPRPLTTTTLGHPRARRRFCITWPRPATCGPRRLASGCRTSRAISRGGEIGCSRPGGTRPWCWRARWRRRRSPRGRSTGRPRRCGSGASRWAPRCAMTRGCCSPTWRGSTRRRRRPTRGCWPSASTNWSRASPARRRTPTWRTWAPGTSPSRCSPPRARSGPIAPRRNSPRPRTSSGRRT